MYCIKPLVTISMETKWSTKKLTCDCMTHHGPRPVCKVSDLNSLWFLRYTVLNWTTTTRSRRIGKIFVISPLLVMQFLPFFRYTCMLPIATILRWQNWIHIESESLNQIFQMYGHDAGKPRPSLYTKYYRTLWYSLSRVLFTLQCL